GHRFCPPLVGPLVVLVSGRRAGQRAKASGPAPGHPAAECLNRGRRWLRRLCPVAKAPGWRARVSHSVVLGSAPVRNREDRPEPLSRRSNVLLATEEPEA